MQASQELNGRHSALEGRDDPFCILIICDITKLIMTCMT